MLSQLAASEVKPNSKGLADWWKQINQWRAPRLPRLREVFADYQTASDYSKVCELTKGDAFALTLANIKCGQRSTTNLITTSLDQLRRPRLHGVGLPYAMGVQMANPDATVACITGEASIQMCIQELATCKQYHLTPKIILLNNRALGMVRQWQQIDYAGRYSESYMDSLPDFTKLVEAYGHVGMKIENPLM